MIKTQTIQWPALLTYYGDDELAYIESEAFWKSNSDLSKFTYDTLDYLLDSSGRVFTLTEWRNGWVQPTATSKLKTHEETIELVRKHAAQLGFCCIAKLYAGSIKEVILLLACGLGD